jgi:hypothetical protein
MAGRVNSSSSSRWATYREASATGARARHPSLLTGMVFDEIGERLTPTYAVKKQFFATAQRLSGTPRQDAISGGMGALRRTIEETVVKKLFNGVVPRWSDRVIVTGLRKVAWDDALVEELVDVYEELSKYIEGHSHTDEATGAPVELKDLDKMVQSVDGLIKRAKLKKN